MRSTIFKDLNCKCDHFSSCPSSMLGIAYTVYHGLHLCTLEQLFLLLEGDKVSKESTLQHTLMLPLAFLSPAYLTSIGAGRYGRVDFGQCVSTTLGSGYVFFTLHNLQGSRSNKVRCDFLEMRK